MPRANAFTCAIGLLTSACAAAGSQAPAADSTDLVVVGVTVIDVETGGLLPDRTVAIRGTRIVRVGPAGKGDIDAGATRVDGRGKFLIPGLWDMHVHSAASAPTEFPAYLAHGVTGVRNMHTSVDTALELTSAIRRRVADGTLLGPRFVANGAIVDGIRSQPGSIPIGTPEAARRIVDSLAAGGAQFVKVYNMLRPDVYAAVVAAASARRLPVVGHVPVMVGVERVAAAGQRSVEHTDGMDFACSTKGDSVRAAFLTARSRQAWYARKVGLTTTWNAGRCADAIAAYARHRTWQVPTLAVSWAEATGDSVLLDTAAMASVTGTVAGRWRAMAADTTHLRDPLARARLDQAMETTRLLHSAGVPILAGTDAGNPFVVPGWSLHHELELLVRAGLSPLAALQSATVKPAEFLGATDSLGTVQAGKLADLVLLDANPIADIRNSRRVHAVVLNGRYLDRAALDALAAGIRGTRAGS